MIEENRPSLFRIIQTDYVAFLMAILPLVLWGFFAFDYFRGVKATSNFLLLLLGLTLIAVVTLLWKIIAIFTVYNRGQETMATINDVSFFRGRGRITYVYNLWDEKYTSRNFVMKNSRTKDYAVGDQVVVLVDSDNPKKAYIKDLYQ